MTEILSLAPTPPANELVTKDALDRPQPPIPLTLLLCSTCGHVQLAEIVHPARLFGHYVYVSGTSPVFVAHFRRYAEDVVQRFGLGASSFAVDIGSNDGTLLKEIKGAGVGAVLGVDPAVEIAEAANRSGVPTIAGFFDTALSRQIRAQRRPADLVTANNVFAHAEDLAAFARSVRDLLADEGAFVFEVSYLVDVVQKLVFDTIYHEHTSYHLVGPLVSFFDRLGLRLFDAQRVDSHGGSLRCFVARKAASQATTSRVGEFVRLEAELGLGSPGVYARFKERIVARGAELRRRLSEIRAQGQGIGGFGAPAKLTTLMHEFGIGRETIDFIVDDSPWKQGLFTPGAHIPIVPSSALYDRNPAFCVVFAWNFADSIVGKHAAYTKQGGHFIVPLPELREI
jgi:SAM-dependent methyltransferase